VIEQRLGMNECLEGLASESAKESFVIAHRAHSWLQPLPLRHNVAFMREIAAVAMPSDLMFLIDHVFGPPSTGWAAAAHGQTPRLTAPEIDVEELRIGVDEQLLAQSGLQAMLR
jgi:hypothetical protein